MQEDIGLKVKDGIDETGKGFRVFVRGLPFDLTDGQLESHFETIGPVKSCFIVNEKGTKNSKGFGFVGYAMRDDAVAACKQLNKKTLLGRRLHVELAAQKGEKPDFMEKRAQKKRKREEKEKDMPIKRQKLEKKKKIPSKAISKTLKVSGFPKRSAKLVRRLLKKFGPVDFVLFPSPESTEGKLVAKVWYKFDHSALTAYKKMTEGYDHLEATFIDKPEKHFRLVMRNLSFQCTEKLLKRAVMKHGEVASLELPIENDRPKGFAFIQYKSPKVAKKAMDKFNKGQLICGRPVAVDWSMGKETYQRMKLHHLRLQNKRSEVENSEKKKVVVEHTKDEGSESKKNENEEEEGKDEEYDKVEEANVAERQDTHEGKDDGDNEQTVTEEASAVNDFLEDSSEDEDDSESLSFSEDRGAKKRRDASEGCTIFVRNVPFTSTQRALMKKFSTFGEVEEAFLTMDPVLKRPKGTGFVKFKKREDVTKLLKKYGFSNKGHRKNNISDQQIRLDGRPLMVSLAISRDQVKSLERENRSDKRNLYLLEEGVIEPDGDEIETLSKQELERRKASYLTKKKKLQNPNFSISRVRLSVQNLPSDWGDKELKGLFHRTSMKLRGKLKYACRHNMPKITQAKVIRDKTRQYEDKKSRSRRFGFIQFREHQDALQVLRELNNKKVEGNRLQIEFALENERIVHIRNQRLKKHQKITKKNLSEQNNSKIKKRGKGKKRERQEQAMDRQKKQKISKDGKNLKRAPLQAKKKKKSKNKSKKQS